MLVLLVATNVVPPWLGTERFQALATATGFTALLLWATYAARGQGRSFRIVAFTALPAAGAVWFLDVGHEGGALAVTLFLLAMLVTLYETLRHVVSPGIVDPGRIHAACCAYLLGASAFAVAFVLVEHFAPGSFQQAADRKLRFIDFNYFSLVTASTLGYGDITPTTHGSRSLAAFEAIAGQLYLAILVATLISLRPAGAWNPPRHDDEA